MSGKRLEEQVSSQQPKEVIIHRLLQKVEKNLLQREREREGERGGGRTENGGRCGGRWRRPYLRNQTATRVNFFPTPSPTFPEVPVVVGGSSSSELAGLIFFLSSSSTSLTAAARLDDAIALGRSACRAVGGPARRAQGFAFRSAHSARRSNPLSTESCWQCAGKSEESRNRFVGKKINYTHLATNLYTRKPRELFPRRPRHDPREASRGKSGLGRGRD